MNDRIADTEVASLSVEDESEATLQSGRRSGLPMETLISLLSYSGAATASESASCFSTIVAARLEPLVRKVIPVRTI
jgi:hypothetical protein